MWNLFDDYDDYKSVLCSCINALLRDCFFRQHFEHTWANVRSVLVSQSKAVRGVCSLEELCHCGRATTMTA